MLTGLLGGFLAWLLTNLVAQPALRFLHLRKETLKLIALFEPRFTSVGLRPPIHVDEERARALRNCGAEWFAFGGGEVLPVGRVFRWFGFDVWAAGNNLMQLANERGGSPINEMAISAILSALRADRPPS